MVEQIFDNCNLKPTYNFSNLLILFNNNADVLCQYSTSQITLSRKNVLSRRQTRKKSASHTYLRGKIFLFVNMFFFQNATADASA